MQNFHKFSNKLKWLFVLVFFQNNSDFTREDQAFIFWFFVKPCDEHLKYFITMSYLPTKYNGGKRWNHAKVYHLNCVKLSSRIMARCLLFWIACSFSNGHAIKHEYSIDANDHCEMWLLLTDIKTKSGTFLAALHQCANKPTQMETFTAAVAKRTVAFF